MKICKYCVFFNAPTEKSNSICSILKIKHPYEPGLYLRNPRQDACSQFKERLITENIRGEKFGTKFNE